MTRLEMRLCHAVMDPKGFLKIKVFPCLMDQLVSSGQSSDVMSMRTDTFPALSVRVESLGEDAGFDTSTGASINVGFDTSTGASINAGFDTSTGAMAGALAGATSELGLVETEKSYQSLYPNIEWPSTRSTSVPPISA